MTSFTFRLQPLMKLRNADRDRCRQELADAYRAEQVLSDRQEKILSQLNETRQLSRQQSLPGSLEIDELLNAHRYELILNAQLQQVALQREKVGAEIERRRQALVEADRSLRILEKLRDRQAEEFQRRELKLETRQLDEIALRKRETTRGGSQS